MAEIFLFVQKEIVTQCGLYVCSYKPQSIVISIKALPLCSHCLQCSVWGVFYSAVLSDC